MKPSANLVFFGSGPVAAATLRALYQANFSIEAIITKPRAGGFRGSVPVIDLAQTWDAPLFTPQNKQELTQLFAQQHFSSPVGLVVDYGIIITQSVIDTFQKGILNSHFSLLPQWRGADPITFALLSGQQKTGVSIMIINSKLDEGLLIDQQTYEIPADATIDQLTEALVELSNSMLIKDVPMYVAGQRTSYPQPDQPVTYSRKIKKEDGTLDWSKTAPQLEREVRAYKGWPKSRSQLFGKDIVVTKARVAHNELDGTLVMPCGSQTWLEIIELIAPSGRTMNGAAFLRGYKK